MSQCVSYVEMFYCTYNTYRAVHHYTITVVYACWPAVIWNYFNIELLVCVRGVKVMARLGSGAHVAQYYCVCRLVAITFGGPDLVSDTAVESLLPEINILILNMLICMLM